MTSTSSLPKHLTVRVTPPPPEGLAVSLCFEMQKKNNFNFLVFIGLDGTAGISERELLEWFDQERSTFLMDYVDPRTNFTGRVTAKVLGTAELCNALKAFEIYRKYLPYPKEYEGLLRKTLERGQDPSEYQVAVQLD